MNTAETREALIQDLLAISTEFRRKYLATAEKSASRLGSGPGVSAGGAELCFQKTIVRCFVLQWLSAQAGFERERSLLPWLRLGPDSSVADFKRALSREGRGLAQRWIAAVFEDTADGFWILSAAPASFWMKLKHAFARSALARDRSDILGEFCQRHAQLHARQSRLSLGQFYTPAPLTHAMWALAQQVLRKRGISLGGDSCRVLDPSAGSGAFLNHGLRLALAKVPRHSAKKRSRIAARFAGFELDPVARSVAILNALIELGPSVEGMRSSGPNTRIFERNAYEAPPEAKTGDHEYQVVITNPPWRNPSPACGDERILEHLKKEVMPWAWQYDGQKLSSIRGCIHGVREDYAFFMGVAIRRLRERGLMVYVTSESWLAAPSFTLLRKYLLDHFEIHAIVRLGPYFDNVRERAAIVVAERTPRAPVGRDQAIRYIDWSDLSNPGWSRAWVDKRLATLDSAPGVVIRPVGEDCRIRESAVSAYSNELPGCMGLERIFKTLHSGAQAGCGPIFLGADRAQVERRVRMLFSGMHAELAREISSGVRGGALKAAQLVGQRAQAVAKTGASYDPRLIRPVLAHFPGNGQARKRGYCYFDPRIWLFPRTARINPHAATVWDSKPKLIFRDMYDPEDKKIIAAVDAEGCVVDNHLFNGGVFVASMRDGEGGSNLTEAGARLRGKFGSDEEFLSYLASVLNSPEVQEWGKLNPLERVKIPQDVQVKVGRKAS